METFSEKEFTAKGIQQHCAKNILEVEKKYQNCISPTSENYSKLESKEFLKSNLVEILLGGETISDSASKQFKCKKKRKRQKSI